MFIYTPSSDRSFVEISVFGREIEPEIVEVANPAQIEAVLDFMKTELREVRFFCSTTNRVFNLAEVLGREGLRRARRDR